MLSGFVLRKYCTNFLHSLSTLAAVVALLPAPALAAKADRLASVRPGEATTGWLGPVEYGEIVYQNNVHSPRQIFIIAQSHRSALSGRTTPDTVKAQAEIYRIGEWLVQEENVNLVLPEGFFKGTPVADVSPTDGVREIIRLDNRRLESELSDTRRFLNASLLLNATHQIQMEQIEDEPLYRRVRGLLLKARGEKSLSLLSELDDLQNERTEAMLKNIPEVVEEAFRSGRISNRKAMFTIGLNHLNEIITFLKRGSPDLSPVNSGLGTGEQNETHLNLLNHGYGVTVIIPKTLAANQQVLRLARWNTD